MQKHKINIRLTDLQMEALSSELAKSYQGNTVMYIEDQTIYEYMNRHAHRFFNYRNRPHTTLTFTRAEAMAFRHFFVKLMEREQAGVEVLIRQVAMMMWQELDKFIYDSIPQWNEVQFYQSEQPPVYGGDSNGEGDLQELHAYDARYVTPRQIQRIDELHYSGYRIHQGATGREVFFS